jgi:hypothetical protein
MNGYATNRGMNLLRSRRRKEQGTVVVLKNLGASRKE